jgi:hypothetical protein
MTADLPEWAMEKAGAALGSPDFSRELLQIRVAYALVAERERAAGIAEAHANSFSNSRDMMVACQEAAADAKALEIATAILADGGPDDAS